MVNIQSIKFDGLTFQYESEGNIFENVDFEFPLNRITWVKAESGSGRSTLLQILAGLQIPNKGRYLLNDENVSDMSFEEFLPYRLQIGYGFDFGGLINNRTLHENVTLPLVYHKLMSAADAKKRVDDYFQRLGMLKYKDQRPSAVPGGTRKLTCLIRALITHPQMLLLDDPSVGLSQDTALKFMDLIQELRQDGFLQHVFLSSFDDKFMSLFEHEEIFIDQGMIHHHFTEGDKKVVHL